MPKIAQVRYTGTMRTHNRRGPSGEQYRFSHPPGDAPRVVPVHDIEDAEAFASVDVLDVEWTGMGRAVAELDGPATGAEAMLEGMGYRAKRRLAKHLDLTFDGNPKEAELDDALEGEVEELQKAMNQ